MGAWGEEGENELVLVLEMLCVLGSACRYADIRASELIAVAVPEWLASECRYGRLISSAGVRSQSGPCSLFDLSQLRD